MMRNKTTKLFFCFALVFGFNQLQAGQTVNGEYFNSLENPHERFSIAKLNSNKIEVAFITSKDVKTTCEAESKKRGFGGFKKPVEACSFFDTSSFNNKCTVVLPPITNYHMIGHEIRHCMQGNYHS